MGVNSFSSPVSPSGDWSAVTRPAGPARCSTFEPTFRPSGHPMPPGARCSPTTATGHARQARPWRLAAGCPGLPFRITLSADGGEATRGCGTACVREAGADEQLRRGCLRAGGGSERAAAAVLWGVHDGCCCRRGARTGARVAGCVHARRAPVTRPWRTGRRLQRDDATVDENDGNE